MRARPRILLDTVVECVSRIHTAEPVTEQDSKHHQTRIHCFGEHTIRRATAAEDRVTAGALDSRNDGTGRRRAFDEHQLVLEARFHLADTYFGTDAGQLVEKSSVVS